jgi:hypothetical protein
VTEASAIEAAVEVAAAYGLEATDPRVLSESNNTVVHLAPAPLVAKVARRRPERLARELDLAVHGIARGAPLVAPSVDPPAGPHRLGTCVLTFWEYVRQAPRRVEAHELAGALRAFHRAIDDYPGELPSFEATIDTARVLLADERRLPLLSADDRAVLRRADARLTAELSSLSWPTRPLHGQPHAGNSLASETGVVLLDLEDACRGPLEWDLAYLPDASVAAFDDVRAELLGVLRQTVSLCVAAWCWADPGRDPEVAEAAHVHVGLLRQAESRV